MAYFTVRFAGVLYHSGNRPYFAFFEDKGHRVKEAPWPMPCMGAAAFLCIIGIPASLYAMPSVDYVPYTAYHVINQLQLLMFAALAFTAETNEDLSFRHSRYQS